MRLKRNYTELGLTRLSRCTPHERWVAVLLPLVRGVRERVKKICWKHSCVIISTQPCEMIPTISLVDGQKLLYTVITTRGAKDYSSLLEGATAPTPKGGEPHGEETQESNQAEDVAQD